MREKKNVERRECRWSMMKDLWPLSLMSQGERKYWVVWVLSSMTKGEIVRSCYHWWLGVVIDVSPKFVYWWAWCCLIISNSVLCLSNCRDIISSMLRRILDIVVSRTMMLAINPLVYVVDEWCCSLLLYFMIIDVLCSWRGYMLWMCTFRVLIPTLSMLWWCYWYV